MKDIEQIKISDYKKESDTNNEWLKNNEELPENFLNRIRDVDKSSTLFELLTKIREELYLIYKGKRDQANSFADSRFTSISEMIERGMISCGALINIFGMTLRKFNIPVKFIHGKYEGQTSKEHRHAWLEVYNPLNKDWFEIDPTRDNFDLLPEALRIKVYHDWQELKYDYEKGDY